MDTRALPSFDQDTPRQPSFPSPLPLPEFSTGTYDRGPQPSPESAPPAVYSEPSQTRIASQATTSPQPSPTASAAEAEKKILRLIPRYEVINGVPRLSPSFDFESWKSHLTPHERALVDNDDSGEGTERVLARDRKVWTYLGQSLRHGISFEQALANDPEAFALAHDRGLLRGDPLTWAKFIEAFGESASRFGRGAAAVAKQLDAELIAKTQYVLNPNPVTREVFLEEQRGVSAQAAASAYFTIRGIADLAQTAWGLDRKARMWFEEKIGALSPAERQERLARMRYEAFKASVEGADQQKLLMEALGEFGHLAKEDVELAGEFISTINPADPMAHLPFGKAASLVGGMGRRAFAAVGKFMPGVTESLRLGLVKTVERRALLEHLVATIEKSGETSSRLDQLRQKLASAVEAETTTKAAFQSALATDAEAVRRAAGQTLGSRMASGGFGLAGRTMTGAVETLGRIEMRADALARKLGAESLGLGRVAVHGVGAAAGAVAGATFGVLVDEDHAGADAALGALAGAAALTFRGKIGVAGEVSRKLSDILKAGPTTQPLLRKLAQETAHLPIARHVADFFDPVMSANPGARGGKLVFNASVDATARTIKGGLSEALGSAAFAGALTYAQEGTTGDDALLGVASGGGQGFVLGAFRGFTAVPHRGVSFQNLEAEVSYFRQRAAADSKYGAANLARFNELTEASQRSLAHFLHVNPDVSLLFTSHPKDVALARQALKPKDEQLGQRAAALAHVDGAAFEHQGRRYILLNPDNPDATLGRVIAHELKHTATENPAVRRQIIDTLLGDPAQNRPGLFTARDAESRPIKGMRDGQEFYETVPHFKEAKSTYLGLLDDSLGVRKEISDAEFALEYDAEATAAHWLKGGFEELVRPTLSGALTRKLREVPFLRDTLGSLGVPFRADFNVAAPHSVIGTFTVTPAMQRLADDYSVAWTRGLKDRAHTTGISLHEQPATAHLLEGSLDLARRADGTPTALRFENGETRLDPAERITRPQEDIARDLARQRATVEAAVAKARDRSHESDAAETSANKPANGTIPPEAEFTRPSADQEGPAVAHAEGPHRSARHVAGDTRAVQPRDDAGTLAGTHLSEDSLFHLLDSDTFSDVHKDTVVALNDHLVDHPGTSLRFLTAEAEGVGADATVRAVWRNEVPYGFVSTPDGSLNLRTLQAERLVPHLEHLWRTDPRARELWAASTTTVSDAWQYLQHHIEGTPLPADLSPAKQAWLDSQLSLERTGASSPLFAPELNPTLADFVGDHRIDQVNGLGYRSDELRFSPRRGNRELRAEAETPESKREAADSRVYRTNFYRAYPHLRGRVVIHHSIEKDVLRNGYAHLFTAEEIHALDSLRGIPKRRNSKLHLRQIRDDWNEFYRSHSPETATREDFFKKRAEIDAKYGHLFLPSLK